ncbi:MAG: HDOD domain-containing protein [Phycisphaerae bacterium]
MSAAAGSTVAPQGRTLPPHLQKAMSRFTEINSLPEITAKVVGVVEDPRATAQDMHEIVKNDPALATKVLKVVNSAFYGLPSQVASLDRAIIMLGLSAVKNIALAASLAQMFKGDPITSQFTPHDLWRHSISVGVCARLLARRAGIAQADEFFVAGLVHDMGLLVIGQLLPAKLTEIAELCSGEPQNYCAAEQRLIEADHQIFGAALATKWKFPPAICNTVAYHHEPDILGADARKVVTMVYVADTICCKMKHGYYLTGEAQEVTAEMLALIGVTPTVMGEVCQELPEQIAEAESILVDV